MPCNFLLHVRMVCNFFHIFIIIIRVHFTFRDLPSEIHRVFLTVHHCGAVGHPGRRGLPGDCARSPDHALRMG